MSGSERLRSPDFASLVQQYFGRYLLNQRNVSAQTISSYRDTFRLFFRFTEDKFRKAPTSLTLDDMGAPQVLAFLDYLENARNNSIRTRNQRLAAIRSFLSYAALQNPAALASVNRALAIPIKRFDTRLVSYLTAEEVAAILVATNRGTWNGQRDHALLTTMYNTGARVSEITRLNVEDLQFGAPTTARIFGKGRKQRIVPLWKSTQSELKDWILRIDPKPDSPLFPNSRGNRLTRTGVRARLNLACNLAAVTCPSLRQRTISPHVFRHTTAMHLLQAGVDITVIALWLGHQSIETTHRYVEADLSMKKRALDTIAPPTQNRQRFRPSDRLMAFLEAL
jgi:integrase/recombinase XerD